MTAHWTPECELRVFAATPLAIEAALLGTLKRHAPQTWPSGTVTCRACIGAWPCQDVTAIKHDLEART